MFVCCVDSAVLILTSITLSVDPVDRSKCKLRPTGGFSGMSVVKK